MARIMVSKSLAWKKTPWIVQALDPDAPAIAETFHKIKEEAIAAATMPFINHKMEGFVDVYKADGSFFYTIHIYDSGKMEVDREVPNGS